MKTKAEITDDDRAVAAAWMRTLGLGGPLWGDDDLERFAQSVADERVAAEKTVTKNNEKTADEKAFDAIAKHHHLDEVLARNPSAWRVPALIAIASLRFGGTLVSEVSSGTPQVTTEPLVLMAYATSGPPARANASTNPAGTFVVIEGGLPGGREVCPQATTVEARAVFVENVPAEYTINARSEERRGFMAYKRVAAKAARAERSGLARTG